MEQPAARLGHLIFNWGKEDRRLSAKSLLMAGTEAPKLWFRRYV
jgi:hypothetical protein